MSNHKENYYGLLVLLRVTSDTVFQLREQELRKIGITPAQSAALIGIRAIGYEATPAKLSRLLFRKSNTTTVLLKRMEKQGLIKKTGDLGKKNLIRLSLTDKGEKAYLKAIKLDSIRDLVNGFSEGELKKLWSLLEKLRDRANGTMGIDIDHYSTLFNDTIKLNSKAIKSKQKKS